MDIREIEVQEDLRAVLAATFGRICRSIVGVECAIDESPRGGQTWYMHRSLSAVTEEGAGREVFEFLRRRSQFSPSRLWLLHLIRISALASTLGSRLWRVPLFSIDPPLPEAEQIAIVPGNRRLRVFELARGSVWSFLKPGTPADANLREISLRMGQDDGPFLPIDRAAEDGAWFEEKILDAFPLPRVPRSWNRPMLETEACRELLAWTTIDDGSSAHWDTWLEETIRAREGVAKKFPQLSLPARADLELLRNCPFLKGEPPVATTHGDFQAGNVLVARDRSQLVITDWENLEQRHSHYDLSTFSLDARSPRDLRVRARCFVEDGASLSRPWLPLTEFVPEWRAEHERRRSVTAFLAEEMRRTLQDLMTGPYENQPMTVEVLLSELLAVHRLVR